MKRRTLLLSTLAFAAFSFATHVASAACSPSSVTLSSIPTWMPPSPGGGCTQSDATALDAALNATAPTAASIEGSVSASCQACIFTESTSATSWQLIVWKDKSTVDYIFNAGACLATAGASHSCASSFTTAAECENDACSACTDGTDYAACASTADTTGGCTSTASAENTACDASSTNAMNACNYGTNAIDSIAPLVLEVCGGTTSTSSTGGTTTGGTTTGTSGSPTAGSDTSDDNGSSSDDGSGGAKPKVVQIGDAPPAEVGGCNTSGARDGEPDAPSGAIFFVAACAMIAGKIKRRSR